MNKKTLILIIVLGIAVIILVWLFLYPSPTSKSPVVQEARDASEVITEGTTITDIEKDLEALLQEQQLLGDLEAQIQQMEKELQREGL